MKPKLEIKKILKYAGITGKTIYSTSVSYMWLSICIYLIKGYGLIEDFSISKLGSFGLIILLSLFYWFSSSKEVLNE